MRRTLRTFTSQFLWNHQRVFSNTRFFHCFKYFSWWQQQNLQRNSPVTRPGRQKCLSSITLSIQNSKGHIIYAYIHYISLLFLLTSSSLRLMRFAIAAGNTAKSLSGMLSRWSTWQLNSCWQRERQCCIGGLFFRQKLEKDWCIYMRCWWDDEVLL